MERLTERDGILVKSRFSGDFATQNILQRLEDYEDAEEQGLLLRLPCKVGDTVWAITSPVNLGFDFDDSESLCVYECTIESITFYKTMKHQVRLYSNGVFVSWYVRFSDFGKLVFLTKDEAERKLAEILKGGGVDAL